MRDIISNIAVASVIAPAAYDADNTPAAIDLQGFDSAMLAIHVGVGGITFSGTNKIEFKLTHSDDDSTYTAVTIDDVQGIASVGSGGIVRSLVAAHAAPSITRVGYVGNKRFLKLLADFSGTHGTATPLSVSLVKGHARERPVA
ncbi:hypothetical protein [Ancylobacter pratisalsi]|uniref:Uncharacterized protein n=1 Tax=Ancylobacter pratisalsi TaxID=1745854 RepID=A0A6P1YJ21_9HYPH|nr:hypothetical protein [Ancylobacter pratisalsi]QIB32686.1 hypothetical protein G3A50_02440 [Ancylobacter pratisalsi]